MPDTPGGGAVLDITGVAPDPIALASGGHRDNGTGDDAPDDGTGDDAPDDGTGDDAP